VPTVLKSGSLNLLEPSEPVQACNGIALPYEILIMPASKLNILYHTDIKPYNHTVMYQMCLILSHSGDFSRVERLYGTVVFMFHVQS